MIRVNERTVELTDVEQAAVARFDSLLDEGHPTPVAAKRALTDMLAGTLRVNEHRSSKRHDGVMPEDQFIAYLSEGRVVRWGHGFALTRQARAELSS